MSAECVRCGRPIADGAYVDTACTDRVRTALLGDDRYDDRPGLVDTAPAARDIAYGLSSPQNGPGGQGVPHSRVPLELAAAAKCDSITRVLTPIVDRIGTERGTTRPWFTQTGDPITIAAHWLADNLEWMRHHPNADTWFTDIETSARIIRGIVRGPAAQRFLGPCGALWWHSQACHAMPQPHVLRCECWCHAGIQEMRPCDGDVYGRPDAEYGSCRTCGARYRRDERQAWLDGEVRTWAFTAKDIADAHGINVKTIRSWAERGQLAEHGRDRDGRPLYLVGDVLDLAAESAARRETNRAQRERRKADRETETEGATAA